MLVHRRLQLAAGGDFNPGAYGGGTLRGSFDAAAITGLVNSDPVSTWTDGSGLGNHATQAGALRPTYQTAIQNGKPGVLFTAASSQFLAANGLASLQNGADQPVTVIAVQRMVTTAAQTFYCWGRTSSGTPLFILEMGGGVIRLNRRDDAAVAKVGSGSASDTNSHLVSAVFTGTLGSTWQDGVSTDSNRDLDVGAMTIDRFSIGCLGRNTDAVFMNGYLFEMVVYASALSTADRQAVERSLGNKWGITVA